MCAQVNAIATTQSLIIRGFWYVESLMKFIKEDQFGAVVVSEQILSGPEQVLLMAQLERLRISPKRTRTGFGGFSQL